MNTFLQSIFILKYLNFAFFIAVFFTYFGFRIRITETPKFKLYQKILNIIFRFMIALFLIMSQIPTFFRNILSIFYIDLPHIETTQEISPLITSSGILILLTITQEEYTLVLDFFNEYIQKFKYSQV